MELILIVGIIWYVIKKAIESENRQKAAQKNTWEETVYEAPKQNVRTTPAREQIQATRQKTQNTSILQRAMANVDEVKEDVTLNALEAEHEHSERVTPAIHHHPEDIIPENVLGTVEDLMVKGYDGNLCFERDFVGEGMDMISHFTVPTDIPEAL